jgi:hypothetical protein
MDITHAAHTLLVLGLVAPFAILSTLTLGVIISIAWQAR